MDHTRFKLQRSIYVVGIPQTGGCWSSNGTAYANFDDAMAELEADRAKNIDYTQVFTFNVYEPMPL